MTYHVLNTWIKRFCVFYFSVFISFFTQTENENMILPNWLNFDGVPKYPQNYPLLWSGSTVFVNVVLMS